MTLWRVAVVVPETAAIAIERAFEATALSVTVYDADPDLAKPKGEQPATWAGDVWLAESCVVEALFQDEPDRGAIEASVAVAAAGFGLAPPALHIAPVTDRDWVAETYCSFPPIVVGRYLVRGSHLEPTAAPGRIAVTVDAATAFGTGEHATTRGCLAALDMLARNRQPRRVLDMGCGTGILAIAAARTWRRPVVAADIDPEAARVATTNAALNGVAGAVRTIRADGYRHPTVRAAAPYDLVLANILARPLVRMAPDLADHLAPAGRAVLSGLLRWQEPMVLAAHRAQGLRLERRIRIDDWTTLLLAR